MKSIEKIECGLKKLMNGVVPRDGKLLLTGARRNLFVPKFRLCTTVVSRSVGVHAHKETSQSTLERALRSTNISR